MIVNSESEVLPSPAGLHVGNVDEVLPTDDLDSSDSNGNTDGETETPASDDASLSDSNGEGNADGETETPTV